jgi:hypothetical protein
MRKPWQRRCPNCHEVIAMYPLPKRIEWEPVWRPVFPCWSCGARLRVTTVGLWVQCLLLGAGVVVFALAPALGALYWALAWWPYIQVPLEVVP